MWPQSNDNQLLEIQIHTERIFLHKQVKSHDKNASFIRFNWTFLFQWEDY